MNSINQQIVIGDLKLDLESQAVTQGGNRVDMAGLSFRLLRVLADHWPAVVSRRQLASEVWGETVVSDDALRQRIRLLRRSLGDSNYVEAVKGLGYRLAAPARVDNSVRRRKVFLVATACIAIVLVVGAFIVQNFSYDVVHAARHAIRH